MSTISSILKTIVKLLLGRGSFRSYSQYGEDAVISTFFRNKIGFYVDVGAYHPVLYSNTYAFYRKGWRGIVVEPNTSSKPLFRFFRPRDIFVGVGVGVGVGKYIKNNDGAYNYYEKNVEGDQLIKLGDIIKKYNVGVINFLNIDVEGMDIEVLHSHDWSVMPDVIAVESDINSDVQKFLENKGYVLKAVAGRTLILKNSIPACNKCIN